MSKFLKKEEKMSMDKGLRVVIQDKLQQDNKKIMN